MVEPLKPNQIEVALKRGSREELAEYERLISEEFETDPSLDDEASRATREKRAQRLKFLSRKLFDW